MMFFRSISAAVCAGLVIWLGVNRLVRVAGAQPASQAASQPTMQPTRPPTFTKAAADAEKNGNPLATFLELVHQEPQYVNSQQWRELYLDLRGTHLSFLGDPRRAQASFDEFEQGHRTE